MKVFVYLTEAEESKMGFGPRELRPLSKHPKKKNHVYLGQWRIGKNVIEGRGVIFNQSGLLYEGYVKNNEITGYGLSTWNSPYKNRLWTGH